MAHTLTYSTSNYRFTIKVNGNAVGSPYQLTNGDVITLDGESYAWDSGTPLGDQYTSWQVSVNGTDIGNQTLSLSGDINIVAEEITGNDTSPQPFSATINYTESTTPTLTFKHLYNAGTIGTGTYKFRHYSQQEPSSGETWVLNETVNISGTNYYNNIEMTYSGQTRAYPIRSLKMYEYSDGPETAYDIYGEEESEYKEGNSRYQLYGTGGGHSGWYHSQDGTAFNVWTFATAPTGDLLTWLQANGVKQGTVTGHTLTFGSELTVTVDGVSVTSPYTLTKNCTIVAATTNGSDLGGTPPKMTVNDVAYGDDTTIALSGTDISVINANQGVGQQFPWSNITVTINYSE